MNNQEIIKLLKRIENRIINIEHGAGIMSCPDCGLEILSTESKATGRCVTCRKPEETE